MDDDNAIPDTFSSRGTGSRAPSILPPAGFFAPKKGADQRQGLSRRTETPEGKYSDTFRSGNSPGAKVGLATDAEIGSSHVPYQRPSDPSTTTNSDQDHPTLATKSQGERTLYEHASSDALLRSRQMSQRSMSQRAGSSDARPSAPVDRLQHTLTPAARLSPLRHKSAPPLPIHPAANEMGNVKRRRRYQDHRGGNKFWLRGLIMTSEDNVLALLASLTVMIAVPIVWFVFDAPYVWRHISPAPVLLFAYLFLVSLTSMLMTSLRDPGVLPRDLDPDPPCTAGEGTSYVPSSDPLAIPVPRVIRVRHGTDLKVKWCDTCGTYRPPRSSHCRVCDNCVENIDHHCTFLNTCIGRRNYFTFTAFLTASILLCALAAAFSALHIYYLTRPADPSNPEAGQSFKEALAKTPASAVLFFLSLGIAAPLVTLICYHIRLIAMNRTTVEQIRINATKVYSEKPDPSEVFDGNSFTETDGHTCLFARKLCCCCGCNVLGQAGRDPNPFAYRTLWRNICASLFRPMAVESWIRRCDFTSVDNRRPNPGIGRATPHP